MSSLHAIALELYDLGHQVIPSTGKIVHVPNWGKAGAERAPRSWVGGNFCAFSHTSLTYVLGPANPLVAFDCDYEDRSDSIAVYRAAREIFGATPLVRIGRNPRFALHYRYSQRLENRRVGHVELKATNTGIAWFGDHPSGVQYHWPVESPLTVEMATVPMIDSAAVTRFLTTVPRLAGRPPTPTVSRSARRGCDPTQYITQLEAELDAMGVGSRHETVVSVIGSMVSQGYGDDEIKNILRERYVERWADSTDRGAKVAQIIRRFRKG